MSLDNDMEFEDLDGRLRSWLKTAQNNLNAMGDLEHRDRAPVTLYIGAMSEAISGNDYLTDALKPLLDEVKTLLRRHCTSNAWPLTLTFKVNSRERLIVEEIGVCNFTFNGLFHKRKGIVEPRWVDYGAESLFGLNQIVSDMRLLQKMTPPSNQPVQAWSTASDLIGSPHVHFEGIHARSKAEALLKMIWAQGGRDGLEEILSKGKIEIKNNDDRVWFVASELQDLHLHPMGTAPRKLEAMEEIFDHLKNIAPDDEPQDEFEP